MPLGIGLKNLDQNGLLIHEKETILCPRASSATLFLNAMDISASVNGATITIASTVPLPVPRKILMTRTDASGSNLAVTVNIVGRRFGRRVTENLTIASGSGAQTVTSANVYDEITSATIASIANNAASDTLSLGTDTLWVGLHKPIKSYKSIRLVQIITSIDSSPVATAAAKTQADLSTTLVLGGLNSAIDVGTLFSTTLAATQAFVIEYAADGEPDFATRRGVKFA